MMSRKGPTTLGKNRTGTVNGDRGNEALSQEAVRLFKTQDLGYVRTMRNKAKKDVEALEQRAAGIKGSGKKIVFVDDEETQKRLAASGKGKDKDTERYGDVFDGFDSEEEEKVAPDENIEAKNFRKMQAREADKLDRELSQAKERLKVLTETEMALDVQRARMAKDPFVGGSRVNKNGVKFKVKQRRLR